jgi:IS5 family transposase
LVEIWNGGLSNESVEEMAELESACDAVSELVVGSDVPDYSVLSRFRTRLTAAKVCGGLLEEINW